jgi:hypothetical protein
VKPTAAKTTTAKPAATATATKTTTAPAAAPTPAADAGDLESKLQEFLIEKLVESDDAGALKYPDGIKKKELLPLVFNTFKTDVPMRNFGAKRVVMPDFLTSVPGAVFEADVLKMAS